jgi:hypothetical protein
MYGLVNVNHIIEQSRLSPRWARDGQTIGESDMAFANYIARHFTPPARRIDRSDLLFLRDVLGIDLGGIELRRVA